ncbi:MAG TPA: DUF3536 domain-containing protein, partial [bacterium]|nr:DUF3536 domain-containing protein [bacterium]
ENFNPCRMYEIRHGSKSIKAFFAHSVFSQMISFQRLFDNADNAGRVLEEFLQGDDKEFLVTLTDGETIGHHHAYAEKGLAYLMKYVLPSKGIQPVNFSYLVKHLQADWEVKLWENSSWSCSHGVGRWMADCGCGHESGFRQTWRVHLREALNWLQARADAVYDEMGRKYFADPWKARDEYIRVILEPLYAERFFEENLIDKDGRSRAILLLEMEKWSLAMFTSCAWFFTEISGLESVKILTFALRVIELAEELTGERLKDDFLKRLEEAPSNIEVYGTGAAVWKELVEPQSRSRLEMVARLVFQYLISGRPTQQLGRIIYHVRENSRTEEPGGDLHMEGELFWEDPVQEEEKIYYFYAHKDGGILLRITDSPFPQVSDTAELKDIGQGEVFRY